MSEKERNPYRLPTNVRPAYYNLNLWTNITGGIEPPVVNEVEPPKFHGYVLIGVDVLESTKEIILNAADLEITQVKFINVESGEEFVPEETVLDNDH